MINFTENKYEDNHLVLCGIYACKTVRNLWLCVVDALHFFKRLIKRYPFAALFVVVFTAVTFSYVEIGKARAERDKLSHELYVMKQKTEQLENIKNR
ncbi:hypothetical protein HMPREF0645_2612 [Hallella bergensis DSM 17361]|uniref:Uncharacterized protein n=1 Tax=Hallella bergensis DSM 17361 TaxID=585502 RepID=D1Q077_9BACT|nr:hypothetical protein [Hallella bergensis]EFA42976.1 hypothetical protein HMPREF0645_2612 [Hallella bergensis DSM 17361]